MNFADAVMLLGGKESKVVAAFDRLVGGALLAVSAAGVPAALSLLGARSELVRLSGDLVSGLDQRLRGLTRFSRSERLAAAHSVTVLSAYFESFDQVELPVSLRELELTTSEQVALAAGTTAPGLVAALLRADIPAPAPQWPFELTLEALFAFYANVSKELLRFVAGLAVWDGLTDTERERMRETLTRRLPELSVARYEEAYRRLAGQFPEFAFWANQVDHRATRLRLDEVNRGLAGLEQLLIALAGGQAPSDHRAALARVYQAALGQPVLSSVDDLAGLRIPLLGEVYVNPDYRVAQTDVADRLARESWWRQHDVRDDLHGFMAGHLTSPQATRAPLLILGQPGSGKSMLTKVLAARLPPSEFLVVRVSLRDVSADADVQTQVEHAVRSAIGEDLRWPHLARSAGDALPVILLDGFDELLQATGVSQSDYLEKVAEFQHRESDLGRPIAVVVTSRTAVAERARSVWGMVAVRLEPFRDAQIEQWLDVWNTTNVGGLRARGLEPLSLDLVLAHTELAGQPLLLLMLAVYDAHDNALRRDMPVRGGELYERLLYRFAEREVRKDSARMSDEELGRAVERDLTRLSVAAFAMFNRNRQWVTETALDADLVALLGDPVGRRSGGMQAELTAAQTMIGRFFFVHEAQASRDDAQLKTYEFLHATFGEYLIARFVGRELVGLADAAGLNAARNRPDPVDDSFLYAILSFAALSTRGTAVSFLAEQVAAFSSTMRQRVYEVVLGLFHRALDARDDLKHGGYRPSRVGVPARHAAYSANLLILAVMAGGEVTASALFPHVGDVVRQWTRTTYLWRSQLLSEGWNRLVHTIAVQREWNGGRDVRLTLATDQTATPPVDLAWSYNQEPTVTSRWRHYSFEDLRLHSHFTCERVDDTVMHALAPLGESTDGAVTAVYVLPDGRTISPAHALLALMTTRSSDWLDAHRDCLLVLSKLNEDNVEEAATILEWAASLTWPPAQDRSESDG